MNKQERDILSKLLQEPFINQRMLSESCGHSLGVVNRSLRDLIKEGYLDDSIRLTDKARKEFQDKAPRNAVILAAGFGMRMVPINTQCPKALMEVNGEPLIERTIRHLHEVGIREIYIVVGFMKEQFEYLIDEFNVELIVNDSYAAKNNLHSLNLVSEHLSNSYIVPCDVWCDRNPFRQNELYSWYMVSDLVDNDSDVRVNRKMELVVVPDQVGGNAMIGISYLTEETACVVRERIRQLCSSSRYDGSFWEEALYEKDRMIVQARVVHAADVVEINTYEQLRELDEGSNQLRSDAISVISEVLDVSTDEISDIEVLKKGMTNRSFLFTAKGSKYIMRIPGEGTDQLINRREEAIVYNTISGMGFCDDPVYVDPVNGYKIMRYIEGVRGCDPFNMDDLKACMRKLKSFHDRRLSVGHEFDIFGKIDFYESLWDGQPSIYKDYAQTKKNVFSLRKFIEDHVTDRVLTHIDAVPDNFLFDDNVEGELHLQLTDWEYAGMQDPHVDIAMFCIYSLYDKEQIDRLIDLYFEGSCPFDVHTKIYCYIAACGLLWSNWCEYKRNLGVEFGEYSLRQYRYAKEYHKLAKAEMEGKDVI
ncbi:MAG: NTP transferase domain-containing protein [Lachnospiraceae bacterium]|nr:NTP transferase domain-containing protein [Muribaculaceae bacterium]MCM1412354.1 NTP transferase domain-containing protein [Lachnospiraceae bacterium]